MADPPEALLTWAASAFGQDATVASVTGLHDGFSPWRIRIVGPEGTLDAILRTSLDPPRWPGGPVALQKLATGAAALRVAERHGLAAPRLIACDLDGHQAGQPASLETVLPGTSGGEADGAPSAEGWRDAGAAIARVHRVPLEPQEHLPLRGHVPLRGPQVQHRWAARYQAADDDERPLVLAAYRKFTLRPDAAPELLLDVHPTPLLLLADEVVRHIPQPRGESVFLHVDVWPGNLLWIGDRCVGLIDWKEAGVGHPGIDLSILRFHAAVHHGPEPAALVLEGWEEEMGRSATDLAYWDALIALNTPMGSDPVEGRTELRDDFLRAAIEQLLL
jgi:aminoglycoside phosphotransferase (APT) family kinase protein